MGRILTALFHGFFGAVAGSVKGILIPEELYRSIVTALGSGGFVGIGLAIVQAILDHVGFIFPNPAVGGLMTLALTLVLDLLRRQNQGAPPAPPAAVGATI